MIPMMDIFFNPNSATSKAAAKTNQETSASNMGAGGSFVKNLFGSIPGLGGGASAIAGASDGGWAAGTTYEDGGAFTRGLGGNIAGLTPDAKKGMGAAGAGMADLGKSLQAQQPAPGAFAPLAPPEADPNIAAWVQANAQRRMQRR